LSNYEKLLVDKAYVTGNLKLNINFLECLIQYRASNFYKSKNYG